MNRADNIRFKIREDGNGYGHLFGEFKKGDEVVSKELATIYLWSDEDIIATVVSIVSTYNSPSEMVTPIEEMAIYTPIEEIERQTKLLMAESKMRWAESDYRSLCRENVKGEKDESTNL